MRVSVVSPHDLKPLVSDELAPVPRQLEEGAASRPSGSGDSVSISKEARRLYVREVQRRLSDTSQNPEPESEREGSTHGSSGQLFHSKA